MNDMDFQEFFEMFRKSREHSEAAAAEVLFRLATEEKPDFKALALLVEEGRKADMPAAVELSDWLNERSELLKNESFLKFDLVSGHMVNAQHRLEVLHLIETTGRDPTKEPEVTFEPWKR